MDRINDGGAAFPGGVNSVYTNLDEGEPTQAGMTLRDYFAAKATDADVEAARLGCEDPEDTGVRCRARFRHADAMLRAREAQSATPSPAPASPSRDALQALPL